MYVQCCCELNPKNINITTHAFHARVLGTSCEVWLGFVLQEETHFCICQWILRCVIISPFGKAATLSDLTASMDLLFLFNNSFKLAACQLLFCYMMWSWTSIFYLVSMIILIFLCLRHNIQCLFWISCCYVVIIWSYLMTCVVWLG